MAWFKRDRKPIAPAEKSSRVPEGTWVKCPDCGQALFNKDLAANLHVCPKCAHHFRLGSLDRLRSLFDNETWVEHDAGLRSTDPLEARALRLSERMGVSVRTARRAARDLDRRRLHFDRTMHRADASDPHNYDLVLDSNSLGLPIAAEVIVRAVEAGLPPKALGVAPEVEPERSPQGPDGTQPAA